jgi:hypothetical protein
LLLSKYYSPVGSRPKAYIRFAHFSRSRKSSLAVPLLQHVRAILQHLLVTSDEEGIMQALVSKAIQISALSASDLTIDRSIETASLAVLEEALKKLPVQGFLNTAVEALKSETETVSIQAVCLVETYLITTLLPLNRLLLEACNLSLRGSL